MEVSNPWGYPQITKMLLVIFHPKNNPILEYPHDFGQLLKTNYGDGSKAIDYYHILGNVELWLCSYGQKVLPVFLSTPINCYKYFTINSNYQPATVMVTQGT